MEIVSLVGYDFNFTSFFDDYYCMMIFGGECY